MANERFAGYVAPRRRRHRWSRVSSLDHAGAEGRATWAVAVPPSRLEDHGSAVMVDRRYWGILRIVERDALRSDRPTTKSGAGGSEATSSLPPAGAARGTRAGSAPGSRVRHRAGPSTSRYGVSGMSGETRHGRARVRVPTPECIGPNPGDVYDGAQEEHVGRGTAVEA